MSKVFNDNRKPTMTREEILAKVNAPVAAPRIVTERTDDIAPLSSYEMPVVKSDGTYTDEDGVTRQIRDISFLK